MTATILMAALFATGSTTGAAKLTEMSVSYRADETTLKGYLVTPDTKPAKAPGVLVIPEWWGNNDYAKMRARMFAELGYTALAIDMYGDGKVVTTPDEAQKLASGVYANPAALLARVNAGLALLKAQPNVDGERIIVVGYCFGGGVALAAARAGVPFWVVGSFHGSLATKKPAQVDAVKARIFVANGGADPLVKAEDLSAFVAEMHNAHVAFALVDYSGALHAFTNPAATELGKKFNMPIAYDAAADKKSWADFLAFVANAAPPR